MQLSAVILAGGQSKRMGRDKAWVESCGKPFVVLALEKLRQLEIREIFLSGRSDQDFSALNCPVLLDLAPGVGPLGGIERALSASTSPLVLVLPVDLPQMTTNFLRKLIQHCDPVTGAVPKLNGELEPLVAIYPKRCHAYAASNITKLQFAVRHFTAACLHERSMRILPVPPEHARCFANCNTPIDLNNLTPA